MPHWMIVFGIVVIAWLALAVGGGLAIGRLLGFISRHLPDLRRRVA